MLVLVDALQLVNRTTLTMHLVKRRETVTLVLRLVQLGLLQFRQPLLLEQPTGLFSLGFLLQLMLIEELLQASLDDGWLVSYIPGGLDCVQLVAVLVEGVLDVLGQSAVGHTCEQLHVLEHLLALVAFSLAKGSALRVKLLLDGVFTAVVARALMNSQAV